MQIKAQALLYAAKWLEGAYGRDALGRVLRECTPAVRDRYIAGIAINWHPLEEYLDFLETSERLLGKGDEKIADEMGAAAARANLKGILLRLAKALDNPEFLMRRIAAVWRQYNDEGELVVMHVDRKLVRFELRGMKTHHALLCATITGWSREVAGVIGVRRPVSRHTSCRARGETACIWDLVSATGRLASDPPRR